MKQITLLFTLSLFSTTLFAQDKSVTPIEFVETISIVGSEEVPLFGGYPTIYEDEILIFDHDAFTIYSFDRAGKLKHHFGSEGQGPGEFKNPQELWRNRDGIYFIHDLGNGRMQRFSSNWEYIDNLHIGFYFNYIPIESDFADYATFHEGSRCEDVSAGCNVILTNHDTGTTKTIGIDTNPYTVGNWFGTTGPDGNFLFYANIGSDFIIKIMLDGTNPTTFQIRSTEHQSLEIDGSLPPRKRMEAMSEASYTSLWGIFLYKNHLIVQHTRRNISDKSDYFISVYDLDGNLVIDAINLDERITAIINDQFYFVEEIDGDEYTSFKIKIANPFFDL